MLTTSNAAGLVSNHQPPQGVVMMRIQLLRNTVAGGAPRAAGDVIEVSEQDGKFLIAIKKAMPAPVVETAHQMDDVPAVETAELPVMDEAKVIRRGKRAKE